MQPTPLSRRGDPHAEPMIHAADPLHGYDESIRPRLAVALAEGRLTPHGLTLLRDRYGLTPAETNVFVEYYLSHSPQSPPNAESKRRELARDLNLSENTLMHHITSIRRKLGLVSRNGSVNIFLWCLMRGITAVPRVPSLAELEPNS